MKKTILMTTLLTFLGISVAFAHCGVCGIGGEKGSMKGSMKENWAEKKVEKMTAHLGLNEEQSGKVKALVDDKMAKKKAAKEEMKAKMNAIRDSYKADLKNILTSEQYEKYESMKEEKKGSMKGSHHEHKGSGYEHKGSN